MIISRTFSRNAPLKGSGPNSSSIGPKHCVVLPIGVFLLGLTPCRSQLFLGYRENTPFLFSTTNGTRPCVKPPDSLHLQSLGRRPTPVALFRTCAPLGAGLLPTSSHPHGFHRRSRN